MSANSHRQRYTFDRVIRLIIGIITIAALLAAVAYLSDVLIPFVIAFLMAYLLNPLVNFVQKHIIKYRIPAIILTLLVVVVVMVAGCLLLAPAIISQCQHLAVLLQNIIQDKNLSQQLPGFLPADWWQACTDFLKRPEVADYLGNPAVRAAAEAPGAVSGAPEAVDLAKDATPPGGWWQALVGFFQDPELSGYLSSERFMGYVRTALSKIVPFAATVFSSVFSGIVSIILTITGATMVVLYLIYILRDYERVSSGWRELIPPEHREWIVGFVNDFDLYMNRYFRAQTIIAGFSAAIMAVGFQIMGLPMGILLGLFCGALSIVPYLQAVGFIPAAVLSLIYSLDTGMSFWWIATQVTLVFIIAQIIYDVILVPKIMGDVTGLSPAVILLSLSVWWKFLGFLGFLVALPMTCLLLAYYRRLINPVTTGAAVGEIPAPPAPAITEPAVSKTVKSSEAPAVSPPGGKE